MCPQYHQVVQSAADTEDAKSVSTACTKGRYFGKNLTGFLHPPPIPPLNLYYLWKILSLTALKHEHAGKDHLETSTVSPLHCCPSHFASHVWKTPCYRSVCCGITDMLLNLWWCQDAEFGVVRVLLFWKVLVLEILQCVKVKWNLLFFSCCVGLYIQ